MTSDLSSLIDKYENLNWDTFLRSDLGVHKFGEVQSHLLYVQEIFNYVISYVKKHQIANQFEQNLIDMLRQLFGLYNEVNSFQNLGEKSNLVMRIQNYVHDMWTKLSNLVAYIQFTENKDTGMVVANSAEIKNLLNDLNQNKDKYKKATQIATQWINTEQKATSKSLEHKAESFAEARDGHNTKGIWGWFALGTISLVGAVSFIIYLIENFGNDISPGSAIMRISILVIASYFAFFCLQQFMHHKKLYNTYNFKVIALDTMRELYKSFGGDSNAKQIILDKGMSIIFSEPVLKEDAQAQQKIIEQVFEIIKSKS